MSQAVRIAAIVLSSEIYCRRSDHTLEVVSVLERRRLPGRGAEDLES